MHNMSKISFASYKFNLLKEDFCVILKKTLRAAILWNNYYCMGQFQLLLYSKSLKLSLHSFLKKILKIPVSDLKKKGNFFQILFKVWPF